MASVLALKLAPALVIGLEQSAALLLGRLMGDNIQFMLLPQQLWFYLVLLVHGSGFPRKAVVAFLEFKKAFDTVSFTPSI